MLWYECSAWKDQI